MRTENVKIKKDIIDNLNQNETSLKLKDSELKPAIENIQVTKSVSWVKKLRVKNQHKSIQVNEARLASKDNELIKTHSVIYKLNTEVLTVTIKESELKTAV